MQPSHTRNAHLTEAHNVFRECARFIREHMSNLSKFFVNGVCPGLHGRIRLRIIHLDVAHDVHLSDLHNLQTDVQRERYHGTEHNERTSKKLSSADGSPHQVGRVVLFF